MTMSKKSYEKAVNKQKIRQQKMKKRNARFEEKLKADEEERINRIIELKNRGDKYGMANELRKMNKRLNERFRQIERREGHPENTTAYRYAMYETGQVRPRYTESLNKILSEDINSIYKKSMDISRKLGSKSASLRGLNLISENRVQGAIEGIKTTLGIDIEDTLEFRRFLEENVNEMIDNNIGSDVIFETFAMAMHKQKGLEILNEKWQEAVARGDRIDAIEMKNWLK